MVTIEEITIAGKRGFSEGEKQLISDWMNIENRLDSKIHELERIEKKGWGLSDSYKDVLKELRLIRHEID